jgi:hypothetical protein
MLMSVWTEIQSWRMWCTSFCFSLSLSLLNGHQQAVLQQVDLFHVLKHVYSALRGLETDVHLSFFVPLPLSLMLQVKCLVYSTEQPTAEVP